MLRLGSGSRAGTRLLVGGCRLADNADDTGSKDRTTVALVGAEIREVKAIITGHAELTAERLNAIRETIGPLKDVPERVTRLEGQGSDHERRISDMEKGKKEDRAWKRGNLPLIVTSCVGVTVSILVLIHQLAG